MSAASCVRRWLARLGVARCGLCRRELTAENQFLDVDGRRWAVCRACVDAPFADDRPRER